MYRYTVRHVIGLLRGTKKQNKRDAERAAKADTSAMLQPGRKLGDMEGSTIRASVQVSNPMVF